MPCNVTCTFPLLATGFKVLQIDLKRSYVVYRKHNSDHMFMQMKGRIIACNLQVIEKRNKLQIKILERELS